MKRLALLIFLIIPVSAMAYAPTAISYVPPPSAMYYSTDGSGNPGTWSPVSGGGSGAITYVPPPSAMYCSSDGSGNKGTWVPCNPTGGGGGGTPGITFVSPSGDTTCAQDTTNIQNAITAAQSSGNAIQLAAGQFYINTLTITTTPISAFRGTGQGTVINYCGTTGNVITIAAHNSTAGNVSTLSPMTISDMLIQQKSGVTPTAGIGLSIAGDGSGYLAGLHIERVSMNGLWQPILLGSNLINDWFKDIFITNCVSTVGVEYNIPVPGGDMFTDGLSLSSSSTAQACSLKIDQSDTTEFSNLKLNGGAGVIFSRAGVGARVRFANFSFEGSSSVPTCAVNFGTAGTNPPVEVTFTGGEIALTTHAFCAGANVNTYSDVGFTVDPTIVIHAPTDFGALANRGGIIYNTAAAAASQTTMIDYNRATVSGSNYSSILLDATGNGTYLNHSDASPGLGMCSSVSAASSDCMVFLKGFGTTSEALRVYDVTTGRGILDFLTNGLVQPETIFSAAGTALPTCNAALKGAFGVVSDATSPTYLGTYTSGGAVTVKVLCNGSTWVTD